MTTQYERGVEKLREVYAGDVFVMPEGTMAFTDIMVRTLFAEVWTREELSIRDRRLLIMGVIAARGESDVYAVQAMAALKNGELTPEELRETVIQLASYAGYPSASALVGVVEGAIAAFESAEKEDE